ncbi:hypothetical protein [Nonomuraea sp. NPDC023979]|uniref:hypothetical protein n=1 Tax=Nonomuraea sp. NPDC023979 TaxID=3154796 RepID=UPI00340E1F5C
MLAIGRAQQGGHAHFAPGEIGGLIRKVNASTGELEPSPDRNIKRWIAKLVDAGLLGQPSTVECLVLPFQMIDSDIKRSPHPCPVHGHTLSWTADGWIDPEALWDDAREEFQRMIESMRLRGVPDEAWQDTKPFRGL